MSARRTRIINKNRKSWSYEYSYFEGDRVIIHRKLITYRSISQVGLVYFYAEPPAGQQVTVSWSPQLRT